MTTGATTLNAVGLVLQLLGAGLAAYGIRQAYREHGTGAFLAYLAEPVADRTKLLIRRVLRRPAPTVTASAHLSAGWGTLTATGRARGHAPATTVEERVAALERQLREEQDRIDELTRRVDAEERARAADVARLDAADEQQRRELESSVHKLAIDGLRLEAAGLFIVTLGALLAGIGSLIA